MSFSGFNLGSSNTPRYGSGVNFDGIDTRATFYGKQPIDTAGKYAFINSDFYKNADPETRKLIAQNELENKSQSNVTELLNFIRETRSPEARKQALQDTLEFQNAQQQAAAPYNMLYKGLDTLSKLPEQISTNAANRAALNVLAGKSITETFNETMAKYPTSTFRSTIPLVQTKYFT